MLVGPSQWETDPMLELLSPPQSEGRVGLQRGRQIPREGRGAQSGGLGPGKWLLDRCHLLVSCLEFQRGLELRCLR